MVGLVRIQVGIKKKQLAVLFHILCVKEELLINRLTLNIQIMLIVLLIAFLKSIIYLSIIYLCIAFVLIPCSQSNFLIIVFIVI